MEGTTATHQWGEGSGWAAWHNNVTWGAPSATVCNWSVSQAYLLGCDMEDGKTQTRGFELATQDSDLRAHREVNVC